MLVIFWTERNFRYLFVVAGIHSTTNLKIYEQAKNFFNPTNTKSSSEESFKKNVIGLLVCAPFHLVQYRNTEFMSWMA